MTVGHMGSSTLTGTHAAIDGVPSRRAGVSAWVVLMIAASAPLLAYPWSFGRRIQPLGPDVFGYVWETRAVGRGSLSLVGTRPGFPVLAAMLSGFRVVAATDAPLVVGFTLAVTLGLVAAVATRLAFRLPAWGLGVTALMVALWGGAIHLSVSYLANELSLVCVALAMTLVVLPGRALRARTAAAFGSALAAGLAHPGFVPFFLGVAALWFVVSIPRLVARARVGERWWDDGAVRFLAVTGAASLATAAVVFGAMGLSVSEVTNITDGVRDFSGKLREAIVGVGLRTVALVVAAILGLVVAWRRRGPSSGALMRATVSWVAVTVVAGLLAWLDPRIPGHRVLLVALPLPAAAGLGLVGMGDAIARGRRAAPPEEGRAGRRRLPVLAGVLAAAVVMLACALAAAPGLAGLSRRAAGPSRGDTARLVASYIATIVPHVPVVVYSSPTTPLASLSWRGRENQIRAYGPDAVLAQTFVVVGGLSGPPDDLSVVPLDPAGLPPETAYAARESWRRAGPALAQGAIVIFPQAYGTTSAWDTAATDPSRVVAPGLAVIEGPRTPPGTAISRRNAIIRSLLCLTVLAALGGGFAVAGARAVGGSAIDAVALAPAAGAALMVLVGVSAGLSGLDPRGIVGIGAVSVAGVMGYANAWRGASRRPPEAAA